ncbi:MAG: hypothetical protein ABI681_04220 [Gemmatimonadales bacterium]
MSTFRIVRDVLDKKLLDADECVMGRVDSIVLGYPDGRQPRMVRVEIGGPLLAAHLASWLVRPVEWLGRNFGPRRRVNVSVQWSHVKKMGRDLHLDIRADDTEALAWENWLAEHVIGRIPGSGA